MNDDEWLDSLTDDQYDAVLADRRRAYTEAIEADARFHVVAAANARVEAAVRRAGPRLERLRQQISSLERLTP